MLRGRYYWRLLVLLVCLCVAWTLMVLMDKIRAIPLQVKVISSTVKPPTRPPFTHKQEETVPSEEDLWSHLKDSSELSETALDQITSSYYTKEPTFETSEAEVQNDTKTSPFYVSRDKFKSALSSNEKELLMDILAVFVGVVEDEGLTYFMYGGTLLGSYRHHDLIPWDDDVDIILPQKSRPVLHRALATTQPDYEVFRAGPRLKFYSNQSQKMSKYPWKWPYVDIHFYLENDTHIWDSAIEFRKYIYSKDIVFPLHQRPLGSLMLNSPRDAYANLRATYKNTKCQTHFYSHKTEKVKKGRVSVSCDRLKDEFPFVHRSPSPEGEGIQESLKLGDEHLYTITVQEPSYALTKPYTLELIGPV